MTRRVGMLLGAAVVALACGGTAVVLAILELRRAIG